MLLSYSVPTVNLLVKKNLRLNSQEATKRMNTLCSMKKSFLVAIAKENNIEVHDKSKPQLVVELLQYYNMVHSEEYKHNQS